MIAERLKRKPGHLVNAIQRRGIGPSEHNQELGEPRLFIFSHCKNTIKEFETYRWKEKSESQAKDINEPDQPEKANDHIMDALRYIAVSYIKVPQETYEEQWTEEAWKL